MPGIIRKGDKTSHGGTVLEGFENYRVHEKPASGMGHQVSCPLCKGIFQIAQGNPSHQYHGRPMAYDGMLTTCGATLISSVENRMTNEMTGVGATQLAELSNYIAAHSWPHNEFFVIKGKNTKEPLPDQEYLVVTGKGRIIKGTTDDHGRTHIVTTENFPEELTVYLVK